MNLRAFLAASLHRGDGTAEGSSGARWLSDLHARIGRLVEEVRAMSGPRGETIRELLVDACLELRLPQYLQALVPELAACTDEAMLAWEVEQGKRCMGLHSAREHVELQGGVPARHEVEAKLAALPEKYGVHEAGYEIVSLVRLLALHTWRISAIFEHINAVSDDQDGLTMHPNPTPLTLTLTSLPPTLL